jgi:hypothetical protein
MKKSQVKATGLAMVGVFTLAVLHPSRAHAYNYPTHSRIAEFAVRAMRPSEVGTPTAPAGEEALFGQYLAAVKAAPARLGLMRTGFPKDPAVGGFSPLPFDGPGTTDFPYPSTNADQCFVSPTETKDLTKVGSFRIQDLDYFPNEWAKPCGLTWPADDPDRQEGRAVSDRVLELVLGWHAGSIDDHMNDSVLWVRPTMVGLLGLSFEAASKIWQLGVGAILLPFVCLYEAIFGDGCNLGDSFTLAQKYNPVDYIQGTIPGIGDIRGDTYTGLWHFEDVDASIHVYNSTRGMWYPGAGPSHPGVIDVVVGAGAQATGLSLNALASDGDDHYGQYDETGRGFPEWQAHTIGMTEFSPLHNLARYGWDKFNASGGTDSSALAWPLHAIGDACEPQHVVGSTAWGHRPYEDVIDNQGKCFLPRSTLQVNLLDGSTYAGDGLGKDQLTRALGIGYHFWKNFNNSGQNMAQFIHDLAVESRSAISAKGDWPYRDGDSTQYVFSQSGANKSLRKALFPGDEASCNSGNPLGGNFADGQALLEKAVGAAIAVLTVAATKVPDVTRGSIDCPSGQTFAIASDIEEVPADPDNGTPAYTVDNTPAGCGLTPANPPPPVDMPPPPDGGPGNISTCANAACDSSTPCSGGLTCTDGCCVDATCPGSTPCTTYDDCAFDYYCSSGCCHKIVVR